MPWLTPLSADAERTSALERIDVRIHSGWRKLGCSVISRSSSFSGICSGTAGSSPGE